MIYPSFPQNPVIPNTYGNGILQRAMGLAGVTAPQLTQYSGQLQQNQSLLDNLTGSHAGNLNDFINANQQANQLNNEGNSLNPYITQATAEQGLIDQNNLLKFRHGLTGSTGVNFQNIQGTSNRFGSSPISTGYSTVMGG